MGARNFLVADVTDIGLVAAIQAQGSQIASFASGIADAMNQKLFTALAGERTPGTQIQILDLFGGLQAVHANPGDFHITDFNYVCATDSACIEDGTGVFFWDGIHPTEFGSSIIAAAAVQAVPEPPVAWLVLAGVFGLALMKRYSSRAVPKRWSRRAGWYTPQYDNRCRGNTGKAPVSRRGGGIRACDSEARD